MFAFSGARELTPSSFGLRFALRGNSVANENSGSLETVILCLGGKKFGGCPFVYLINFVNSLFI